MNTPHLQCHELVKRYGSQTVVDRVSFHIDPGECLGIIGPNGAGKTTTLRMLLGLASPDSGHVQAFEMRMPQAAAAIKARLGVVSQFDSLDPDFTCEENLRVYGRYFGLSNETLQERIPKGLAFAALTHKAKSRPGDLSGGMKRRLSLARALINDPALLLLDEPTTGLDPQARHLMWERLQQLLQQGKSILLTTHFMDEAERLCDRLIVLDHGRVIAQGTPRDLIRTHLEPEVIELFGPNAVALVQANTTASAQPEAMRGSSPLSSFAERIETSGETVFFYTRHAQPLLEALMKYPELHSLHRPANLEDLFLKLTGRHIREGA